MSTFMMLAVSWADAGTVDRSDPGGVVVDGCGDVLRRSGEVGGDRRNVENVPIPGRVVLRGLDGGGAGGRRSPPPPLAIRLHDRPAGRIRRPHPDGLTCDKDQDEHAHGADELPTMAPGLGAPPLHPRWLVIGRRAL